MKRLSSFKVKRGASAGSLVPLASLVVTDQSAVDMTVLLWRRAAFWAAAVGVGDVLFITGAQTRPPRSYVINVWAWEWVGVFHPEL